MNKRKKINYFRNDKGITLVALVVTIIVLIILAGISINLILGENGLIQKAKQASTEYEEAETKEKLSMLLAEYEIHRLSNNVSLKDFLTEKQSKIGIEEILENGDGTYTIILDGYMTTINQDKLAVEEIVKETEFIKTTRNKAEFVYDNQSGYVGVANVTIDIDESVSQYTVQYRIGTEEDAQWIDYTAGSNIEVSSNCVIYARFVNKDTNETGYSFKLGVNNIDEIAPEEAKIEFDKTTVSAGSTIKATITQNDDKSGIEIGNSKYIINTSSDKIDVDSTSWDSATIFESNPQTIDITQTTGGTYFVHVLSVDSAGNKTSKVSEGIVFKAPVNLLNTTLFGHTNAPLNTTGISTWTIYNNSNHAVAPNGFSMDGGNGRYFITDSKINFDNIDELTLYISLMHRSTFNGVVQGELYFGITEERTSNSFVKEQHISWNANHDIHGAESIVLDTSDIKGEYYVKILGICNVGSIRVNDGTNATVTGK